MILLTWVFIHFFSLDYLKYSLKKKHSEEKPSHIYIYNM